MYLTKVGIVCSHPFNCGRLRYCDGRSKAKYFIRTIKDFMEIMVSHLHHLGIL